jgi:uncharacterized phage protein (TIGR02218 family)
MSDPWLIGPVTSAAYGWRLERRDGVTIAFTSHDRDVEIDGVLHLSSPGMLPSSILESLGPETDGLEVKGNLDSAAIRVEDIEAGRWNRARLTIYLFDWNAPLTGKRMLATGELGEISYSSDGFDAELRGLTALFDRPVVPQTSPGCRAAFCDAECGLNRRRYAHELRIQQAIAEQIVFASPLPDASNAFAFGRLRWLDGANCGLISDIVSNTASQITLVRAPSFIPMTGARVELVEGCDKTLATCSTRFANAINFRGEPYLPGNDLLTRYPGAG